MIRSPRDAHTWKFSLGLAGRLPTVWAPFWRDISTSYERNKLLDRLWDLGSAQWVLMGFASDRVTQLRHHGGLELVVIPRPRRPHQYLVGALVPIGYGGTSEVEHLDPLPFAISVPSDPARAAEAVRARLLPPYQQALRSLFHPGGWSVIDSDSARATGAAALGLREPAPTRAPAASDAARAVPTRVSGSRTR